MMTPTQTEILGNIAGWIMTEAVKDETTWADAERQIHQQLALARESDPAYVPIALAAGGAK